MTRRNILLVILALVIALFFLTGSHNAYAGRCDGNQGNGQGNICEPATPASPHTTQSNRQYIERVHGYAHGNSLGIQALRRTTNAIEKVNVRQDAEIAGKVDTAVFVADQARQDARANQADLGIEENRVVNVQQNVRLGGHDTDIRNLQSVNAALDTRLGGAYQRLDQHSAQIARLERQSERSYEANAIALAVAGHQFNTQGGFQTAVSAATVNGKQALAVGMGGAVNDRLFINAGVSASGSTTGGVVSSTYAW